LRPLGITALEDKIVQRAVGTVLGAVYEADIKGFSYGFRPGRSRHLWAVQWRQRQAKGQMITVRYADDVVVGFELEADARAFWDAMRERFKQFSLEPHEDKTRLLEFGRLAATRRERRGRGKPETFKFLGFLFICGKTRRGAYQLKRKTRSDRMRTRLQDIKAKLRQRMHDSIPGQGKWLR